MIKLRHIAIAVPDIPATAKSYEAPAIPTASSSDIANGGHTQRVWRIPA